MSRKKVVKFPESIEVKRARDELRAFAKETRKRAAGHPEAGLVRMAATTAEDAANGPDPVRVLRILKQKLAK